MSRCSPGCITPTPMLCRWWRRPPSSGAPVISRLLRSVVGRDAKDVDDVVTELVRARVLERRGTDGWRFRHELLREVAAELAPPIAAPRAARPDCPRAGRRGGRRRARLARGREPLRAGAAVRRRRRGLPEGLGERPAARRSPGGAGLPDDGTQPAHPLRRGLRRETAGRSPSGWSVVSWRAPRKAA